MSPVGRFLCGWSAQVGMVRPGRLLASEPGHSESTRIWAGRPWQSVVARGPAIVVPTHVRRQIHQRHIPATCVARDSCGADGITLLLRLVSGPHSPTQADQRQAHRDATIRLPTEWDIFRDPSADWTSCLNRLTVGSVPWPGRELPLPARPGHPSAGRWERAVHPGDRKRPARMGPARGATPLAYGWSGGGGRLALEGRLAERYRDRTCAGAVSAIEVSSELSHLIYPRQRAQAACLVVPDSSATSLQDRLPARVRAAWPTRSPA